MEKSTHIYSTFFLGATEIAINVDSIQEVVNYPDKISLIPLAPDFLVGIFNLRSLLIPIINLKKLLKISDMFISGTEKVAIVEHKGVRIGLIFDKTNEIIKIHSKDYHKFCYIEGSGPNVISGAIKLNGGERILQLIDPFAIVNIENIPQVSDHQQSHLKLMLRSGHNHENIKKCISFSVGETSMAFQISDIHEIVKAEDIKQSTFETEICLGIINLRGQIVPIINFSKLLGIAQSQDLLMLEKKIVVLKLGLELFGLLVDSVNSISTYLVTELIPIPLFQNNRVAMFEGCISIKNHEVFLLNPNYIFSNEEVIALTQGHSKIYKSEIDKESMNKDILKSETYISFRLNHLFGVSIKDVIEIIDYPTNLLQTPGLPAFVLGMLNLRGEIVFIIETRHLYSLRNDNDKSLDKSKVLIFVKGKEKYGLVVDYVESIISINNKQKIKIPDLMVQQINSSFENDIKEIISILHDDGKESALIILNMEPVAERIKRAYQALV